jgi:hypothetical protein
MSAMDASAVAVLAALEAAEPAGGARIEDIGLASGIAGFAIIVLLMGGLGHRGGMVPILGWFERFAERVSGQPAWASLPCGLAIISLISAVFGLYWDVSLHIDVGRDVGPLNNPAHYFILAGLYGIFASGFFAICLGREERADRPGPTAIRLGPDWYAPLGGVIMCATGGFSLIGFPLDDGWHRLFGQDVTLWGPTHLMLIGGAAMTLLGIAIIQVEVQRAMKLSGLPDEERIWVKGLRNIALPGGLLIGLSTFTGEFDWGVPQFQLVYHPMLLMLAVSITLVATRIWLGRGTAIGAVLFFVALRGALALSVGPGLGESVPRFPSRPRSSSSSRWPSRSGARSPSQPPAARSSARWASPPNGAGRTSGRRSPGPSRSCPRRLRSASRARSPARSSAPGSALGWAPSGSPTTPACAGSA